MKTRNVVHNDASKDAWISSRRLNDGARTWFAFSPMLFLFIASSFAFSVLLFKGFTAEDAYIVYRYAEHFHSLGALIYNEGERINALTSPLHALLVSLLYGVTGESVTSNKLGSLVLLLIAAGAVAYRYRQQALLAALALSLVLLPPCVVLWTLGGLETPLLLSLVTAATLIALGENSQRPSRLYLVFFLGGLGFLTRYDAALYFAPLALAAWLAERRWRHRLLALSCGAALPAVWLVSAYGYYGDIFPTSYYIKTPHAGLHWMAGNAGYVLWGLTLTGLLPALLLWYVQGSNNKLLQRVATSLRALWPLYLGLALELAYSLTAATTHMMFSFRMLVPYLPAGALIVVESIRMEQPGSGGPGRHRRWQALTAGFVILLCVVQAASAWITYTRSLNPFPRAEFRGTGSRDFMSVFMQSLWKQSAAIRRDWASRAASAQRPPRIFTYAGGVVPYALPESYVFETLASYRHGAARYGNWARYADYAMVVTPFFGPLEQQLPGTAPYLLIFEERFALHGQLQSFRVYHNPDPLLPPLGNRIDRCCQK